MRTVLPNKRRTAGTAGFGTEYFLFPNGQSRSHLYKDKNMLLPDFTKNKENEALMYFSLENKKANELMDMLEKFYPGYSEMKIESAEGKKYVCVHIGYTEF